MCFDLLDPGFIYNMKGLAWKVFIDISEQIRNVLRIDYGDDGTMHALVHSNLNSSALDYPN